MKFVERRLEPERARRGEKAGSHGDRRAVEIETQELEAVVARRRRDRLAEEGGVGRVGGQGGPGLALPPHRLELQELFGPARRIGRIVELAQLERAELGEAGTVAAMLAAALGAHVAAIIVLRRERCLEKWADFAVHGGAAAAEL